MIESEVNHYLPFLLTTTIMMEAVKGGAGREDAHSAIKQHAVATVKELREGEIKENDLASRLAADDRIGLKFEVIEDLIKKGQERIGAAHSQVDYFLGRAESWAKRYPNAVEYKPPSIL